MSKLNWQRRFKHPSSNRIEEEFIESQHKFILKGRTIMHCPGVPGGSGGHWVTEHDYWTYCKQGKHEFAEFIDEDELRRHGALK